MISHPPHDQQGDVTKGLKHRGAFRGLLAAFGLIVFVWSIASLALGGDSEGLSCVFQCDQDDYNNMPCNFAVASGILAVFIAFLTLSLDLIAEKSPSMDGVTKRRLHMINFVSLALLALLAVGTTITSTVLYAHARQRRYYGHHYTRCDYDRTADRPGILTFLYGMSVLSVFVLVFENAAMRRSIVVALPLQVASPSQRIAPMLQLSHQSATGTSAAVSAFPPNRPLHHVSGHVEHKERKAAFFRAFFSIISLVVSLSILIVIQTKVVVDHYNNKLCGFELYEVQRSTFHHYYYWYDDSTGFYNHRTMVTCDFLSSLSGLFILPALLCALFDILLIKNKLTFKQKKIFLIFYSCVAVCILCLWIVASVFSTARYANNSDKEDLWYEVKASIIAVIALSCVSMLIWLFLSISSIHNARGACKKRLSAVPVHFSNLNYDSAIATRPSNASEQRTGVVQPPLQERPEENNASHATVTRQEPA